MKKLLTTFMVFFGAMVLIHAQHGGALPGRTAHSSDTKHGFRSFSLKSVDDPSSLQQFLNRLPNKRTTLIMQRLDSIIELIQEPFKNSLSLINNERIFFYYDVNQLQTHEIAYAWDSGSGQWVLDTKTEFTYNVYGQVLTYTDYLWDGIANQWVQDYKYEFEYNANGDLVTETDSYFNTITSSWVPEYKYEYIWDMSGGLSSTTESHYNEDLMQWEYEYKFEFEYNAFMDLEEEVKFQWDDGTSQWVYDFKQEYSYNANNDLILIEYFIWDEDLGIWEYDFKMEYSYDGQGLLLNKISFSYISDQWQYSHKTEYGYDMQYNVILRDDYYYDEFNLNWYNYYKEHIDYNLAYTFNDLILPTTWWWFGEPASYMITDMYAENNYTGSWMDSYHRSFHYSAVNVTGIQETDNAIVLVYPNPTNNQFRVSWKDQLPDRRLELFESTGKKIIDRKITNDFSVDAGQLGKGVYYYRITSGGTDPVTGKINLQ